MNDARLRRFVVAHLVTVVAEWAATVGVLVHAYAWGGSRAVGIVSLAVLSPPLVGAPLAAAMTARYRAHRIRMAGFAIQAVGFAGAAVFASISAPTPVVAVFVVMGLGAINTLRPTGAILLPAAVSSTRQLVTTNLWVSWCDSASALVGPLLAAGLGAAGGPTAIFAGCSVAAVIALGVTAWRPAPLVRDRVGGGTVDGSSRGSMRLALGDLRERPWSIGVLGAASARNIMVGALDVILVVIALRTLDLGDSGPGVLSALVGTGALVSAFVATVVVRSARLRPALAAALIATASSCVVLGIRLDEPVAIVVLPLLGVCLSLTDNLSRMLLQRSTDPRHLGPLFALLGLVAGLGQLVGSALAQVLLALGDVDLALIGLGVLLFGLAAVSARSLRRADAHAEVPVVEMSLLVGLPMFSPLPPITLEAVARTAEHLDVEDGVQVVVQGEQGDLFYAVKDGAFDIVMSGELIRTARRGDFFGEVALLTERTRTATVTAKGPGALLSIHRDPFLLAVTGHDVSHAAAMEHVGTMRLTAEGEPA